MHTKEILVGHPPGIDLHYALVKRQQIAAYGGGQGAEPALVLRMPPTSVVKRCFRMEEEPHRGSNLSHSLPPQGASRRRCALEVTVLDTFSSVER